MTRWRSRGPADLPLTTKASNRHLRPPHSLTPSYAFPPSGYVEVSAQVSRCATGFLLLPADRNRCPSPPSPLNPPPRCCSSARDSLPSPSRSARLTPVWELSHTLASYLLATNSPYHPHSHPLPPSHTLPLTRTLTYCRLTIPQLLRPYSHLLPLAHP